MNQTAEAENTELTDQQMDELVSKAESPRGDREIPMTQESAPPQAPTPDESIEFTHNGKPIKATREQLIKWAQQGYDYPQKAQKFNQEKFKWEQDRQQWEQKWGPYKQIDEWANKNPDKWKSLHQTWEQSQQGMSAPQAQNPNDPYLSKFQQLEQRLQQFEPVVQSVVEKFTTAEQQQQDQKLDQEIQSIQGKYKDLDWTTPDENGKSLEFKVLEHAHTNGIQNFSTAFKDFYHDELIARAEAQAKQNVSKDIQAKTKMGIIGTSPTPKLGVPPVKDVKKQSYEDIMTEIRAERAQGLY